MPKKTKNKTSLSEPAIYSLLKKRYSSPEYAIFRGVQNSTGFARSNEADAVAMGLWPSRGMEVLGFEIKSYRSDWLSELRQPKKSDAIQRYCDRWWIVAAEKGLVNVEGGELPPTWGLMVVQGKRLVSVVEAPKLESKKLDRGFVAALLRRAHESTRDPGLEQRLREEIRKELEEASEIGKKSELKIAHHEIENLEKKIQEYEQAQRIAGIPMGTWHLDEIARAVNFVRYQLDDKYLKELLRTRSIAESFCIEINDTIKELKKEKEDGHGQDI